MSEQTVPEELANGDIEGHAELVRAPAPQPTVFGTDDPMQIMARTAEVADGLKQFVVKQQLTVKIQQNDYLLAEAWEMLGMMLGVTAVGVSCEPITDHEGKAGWEATAELRDRTGRVIGAARARCTRSERRWAKADDNHVESMAQTRAASKAFRSVFGFIAKAAGYATTPAEEMPASEAAQVPDAPASPRTLRLTTKQRQQLTEAIHAYLDLGLNMEALNLRLLKAGANGKGDDLDDAIKSLEREPGKEVFVWLEAEIDGELTRRGEAKS